MAAAAAFSVAPATPLVVAQQAERVHYPAVRVQRQFRAAAPLPLACRAVATERPRPQLRSLPTLPRGHAASLTLQSGSRPASASLQGLWLHFQVACTVIMANDIVNISCRRQPGKHEHTEEHILTIDTRG